MMELQCTRDVSEPELANILDGLTKDDVARIDELHSDKDNDAEYVFIIWATSVDAADKVFKQLKKNASKYEACVKQLSLGIYSWSEII